MYLELSKHCKLPENRDFRFPIVYNSADEQVETLQLLDGHIDIYLRIKVLQQLLRRSVLACGEITVSCRSGY